MAEPEKDKDLDETKRIMERLVKTPPDPKAKSDKHVSEAAVRRALSTPPKPKQQTVKPKGAPKREKAKPAT